MTTSFTMLPPESRLHGYMKPGDFIDCVETNPIDPNLSISALARQLMASKPSWMPALLALRDALVAPFGVKTTQDILTSEAALSNSSQSKASTDLTSGDYVSFFRVQEVHESEIILGEDDRHLNFRITLFKPEPASGRIFLATWVHRNNLMGRIYLTAIMPFHKAIVFQMAKGLSHKPKVS
ncbi:DUF2867 domain-containing protein [Roseibium algae]|uniref:DUF2867 domain-containing protein n=1 Tax=Roseibium algae TaxID=3123038 RepID=A0ABU8TKI7_9HYPH